ncbi:MAG: FG-GAP repeat protein [Myxococcota bacterium]
MENERVLSNLCEACPPGATNEAGDDASGADTSCDGTDCASNQRVVNNACVGCPPGTTNEAGDDPAGQDTACDPIECMENERVENNVCVPCGPGTTNEAGDDASGNDTTCDDACSLAFGDGVTCDVFNEAYVKASNTDEGDLFGLSVALSGDTLAVGAPGEDSNATGVNGDPTRNAAFRSGAVYMFTRSNGMWRQEAYLKASNKIGRAT